MTTSRHDAITGFSRFAGEAADIAGTPWAFGLAMASIGVWASFGPAFHYSDAWQLVMNSWTNFVTFAMVFLIQHAQNRDSRAINLKLNEMLRAMSSAENELIDVETLSDSELQRLERRYALLRSELLARRRRQQ